LEVFHLTVSIARVHDHDANGFCGFVSLSFCIFVGHKFSHHSPCIHTSCSIVTEGEFRAFFKKFGALIDCIVMIDPDTNRSRGFGFVSYEDPAVARKLLQMRVDNADSVKSGKESDKDETETGISGELTSGRMKMRGKLIEIKAAQPKGETRPSTTRRGNNISKFHDIPAGDPRHTYHSPKYLGNYQPGFAPPVEAAYYNPMYTPQYAYDSTVGPAPGAYYVASPAPAYPAMPQQGFYPVADPNFFPPNQFYPAPMAPGFVAPGMMYGPAQYPYPMQPEGQHAMMAHPETPQAIPITDANAPCVPGNENGESAPPEE